MAPAQSTPRAPPPPRRMRCPRPPRRLLTPPLWPQPADPGPPATVLRAPDVPRRRTAGTRRRPHMGARMTSIRTLRRRLGPSPRRSTGRTQRHLLRLPIPIHLLRPVTTKRKRTSPPSSPPSPAPSPPRSRATPSRPPAPLQKGSTSSSPSQRSAGVW
jgi:hypothetical protein